MATTTPAFNIKVPQRPDPADLTADLAISYGQIDSVLSQVNGTAVQASTDASQAEATAGQAMAVVASYDDPVHVGPSEPTGDEKLWADTDEPAPGPPDTGWVDITSIAGTAISSGRILIRRRDITCWYALDEVVLPSPGASFTNIGALPTGYRPSIQSADFSTSPREAADNFAGIRLTTGGNTYIYGAQAGVTYSTIGCYPTDEAWPA